MAKRLTNIQTAIGNAKSEEFDFTFRDETFTSKGDIPGILMLEFFAAADDDENVSKVSKATLDFLDYAIVEDQKKKFRKFLLEADPPISPTELTEFAFKLIGEISGNQEEQSEDL